MNLFRLPLNIFVVVVLSKERHPSVVLMICAAALLLLQGCRSANTSFSSSPPSPHLHHSQPSLPFSTCFPACACAPPLLCPWLRLMTIKLKTTTSRCKAMQCNSRNLLHSAQKSKTPLNLCTSLQKAFMSASHRQAATRIRGLPRVNEEEEVVATERVASGLGAREEEA